MIGLPGAGARHNPFCSERVRPGSLSFRFDGEGSLDQIIACWEKAGRVGQIVGPHGTGKSTLLYSLRARFEELGIDAQLREAGDQAYPRARIGTTFLLDSAERHSPRRIRSLARAVRKARAGLIITAHSDMSLPLLRTTAVSPSTASALVEELLEGSGMHPPSAEFTGALLARQAGNFRLALFDLYDWYEARAAEDMPT